MKQDQANNQRGEVIIGVMMVIMCAVMLFGGMHMMHGGHLHSDERDRKVEEKHNHRKEESHHPLNDSGEYRSATMKQQNLNNNHAKSSRQKEPVLL